MFYKTSSMAASVSVWVVSFALNVWMDILHDSFFNEIFDLEKTFVCTFELKL